MRWIRRLFIRKLALAICPVLLAAALVGALCAPVSALPAPYFVSKGAQATQPNDRGIFATLAIPSSAGGMTQGKIYAGVGFLKAASMGEKLQEVLAPIHQPQQDAHGKRPKACLRDPLRCSDAIVEILFRS